jgi:polyisoprenoid-binding protein YceI
VTVSRGRCGSGFGPLLIGAICLGSAGAQQQAIDTARSTITVQVDKAGLFSVLGHDHVVTAPLAGGMVDVAAGAVSLRVTAAKLTVVDEKTSEKDRAEIQKTMLGPEVLDVQAYPEIGFRATGVETRGADAWTVRGALTLHGQTKPVTVQVERKNGHYVGTSRFRQTEFGIKPVKVAGGAVRVKDEVRIEFDIQTTP